MGAYKVGAGSTFKAGDLVKLSGTANEIINAPDAGVLILGIACDAAVPTDGRATNVGRTILVEEATPDVIFSAQYFGGAPSTNIAIGDKVGVNVTGSVYTVDAAKAAAFVTRGFDDSDQTNAVANVTQNRVLVSILAAASQAAGGDAAG
jgi:hypothetical protein